MCLFWSFSPESNTLKEKKGEFRCVVQKGHDVTNTVMNGSVTLEDIAQQLMDRNQNKVIIKGIRIVQRVYTKVYLEPYGP